MSIRQRLTRLFYPYGSQRTVLRGAARGYRYIVQPGMGASFALGFFDSGSEFFSRQLEQAAVIYDVGANRGQFSLVLSALDCRVCAFEPVPSVYADLESNIHMNHLANVSAFNLALSDQTGTASFLFDQHSPTQGRLEDVEPEYRNEGGRLTVETQTMDEFVASGHPAPTHIKIDVEGGAYSVLRGARETIRTHRPAILIELHGPEEQQGVQSELLDSGYALSTLTGEVVTDPVGQWYGTLWCQPGELATDASTHD